MASTAGLDQTDDASALSYFQKTVCLHDWWLVKSDREFEGKRLAVAGSTAREKQAVRLFSSAPIVKRYDFSTMETADGICVVIKGFINKPRTQENGFPSMVGSHFVLGFPTDWEEYATKFMEGDSTNGIHSGTISDSAIAGTEKSCPTSEQTPNNHEQVTHRGSLKNSPGSGCSMKHKNKMLSPKTKTFENPDGAKLNSSSGVSIQPEGIMDISDNVPDHSVGQILGSLSENVRGKGKDEKCTVSGLKSESIKMNSVPVASGNMSEILKNHKFEFEDNSIPSSSTYEGKSDDAKEGADRKKTKRNLIFDQNVSRSQELKNEKSIVSPESLSYGRSRSGRLLLPTMEFWRNQLPVYDADRKITGIMTEKDVRSVPQKGKRKVRKEGLCSVLLRTSSLFGRHYCSSNLVGAACATALRSPDLVALEYADLNLTHKVSEELGHVRIRQHVNPLSASFSMPADAPEWDEIFKDPTLPLMVDVGSGSGRFLLWLAKRNPEEKNYLGLEIRQKLVKRANFWVKELALSNIHFLFANATISFNQLVSTYPGPLMLVSILCPDPHFKKRHHKRRVVQKHLVDSIIKNLMRGGQVFIQSDVLEVALDMRNQFDADVDVLHHIDALSQSVLCDNEGWLLSNPMGIRTEREIHAELEGARIFRRMYQKMA